MILPVIVLRCTIPQPRIYVSSLRRVREGIVPGIFLRFRTDVTIIAPIAPYLWLVAGVVRDL